MYPAMSSSKPWTGRATAALFLTALTLASRATASLSVVHKDVVILGGGASGTHAAVRLREDYGKSVLLIEKEPILVNKKKHNPQEEEGGSAAATATKLEGRDS